ncbi:MAG: SRPBCC family protein [Gemmatimonadota bacterium]|jgi:carbon monoxide dehydrogenase subunit G
MATLLIKERFDVPAPPDLVFALLVDPERVVVCLPGAALEESEDERTHRGTVTVKMGAVTVSYRGTMEFEEVDEAARRVRVKGTGREKSGSGSARMTMTGRVEATEDGSTVTVDAEVEVAGKIVRFGRGMIQRVSREIFRDFASCLAERVQPEEDPEAVGREEATGGGGTEEGAPAARAFPLLLRALRGWLRDVVATLTGRKR